MLALELAHADNGRWRKSKRSRVEWWGRGRGRLQSRVLVSAAKGEGSSVCPQLRVRQPTCVVCQLARAKCMRPGEESVELKVMCWRKHMEDKSPQEKKKWACMVESEGTKGLEGTRRFQRSGRGVEKGVVEAGPSGSGGELTLIQSLFHCLNEQNSLLNELVGLKEQEVYGGWSEMEDKETDEDEDVEVSGSEVMGLGEESAEVRKVGAEVAKGLESGEEESNDNMEV